MSSNHIPQLSISAIQVSYKAPKPVISLREENKTKTKTKSQNQQNQTPPPPPSYKN